MTNRTLYALTIPEDSQMNTGSSLAVSQRSQGVQEGGPAAVEAISSGAKSTNLVGQYRGELGDVMAAEFEELFGSSGFEQVPYFADEESQIIRDGYYSLKDVSTSPIEPRMGNLAKFDGTLTYVGSRETHFRAHRTNPTTVDNPFGTGTAAYISVPKHARRVRWYDVESGATEAASLVETRTGRRAEFKVYDASASTYATPVLIYDVPYQREADADVLVYDERGVDRVIVPTTPSTNPPDAKVGTATVGSARVDGDRTGKAPWEVPQWQLVFDEAHRFDGEIVLENELFRMHVDGKRDNMRFYEWKPVISDWSRVPLGKSDWAPADFDLTRIGPTRVDAQVDFRRGSDGTEYTLDVSVKRGYDRPLWSVPTNQSGTVPTGLKTKLDPIAATSDNDPMSVKDAVARSEVRK